jgi:hypothetical protein
MSTQISFTVITIEDGTLITLPIAGVTSVDISWGDASGSSFTSNSDYPDFTYDSSGTYIINLSNCNFTTINNENNPNRAVFNNSLSNFSYYNQISSLTSFANAFYGAQIDFSLDISSNATSNVSAMNAMFYGCTNFNQPVLFDTTACNTFENMFNGCSAFNQPVSFNTSSVNSLANMFYGCGIFDSSLNLTDTSSVSDFNNMFGGCSVFNQPVPFDTSSATNFSNMFDGCSAFNQDISSWLIPLLTNASGMLNNTSFSTANYNSLLIDWANQSIIQTGVPFGASTTQYSGSEANTARNTLIIDYSWNITDAGAILPNSFTYDNILYTPTSITQVAVGDNQGYAGGTAALEIPNTVTDASGNPYTVTSVSINAFRDNTTITSVDFTDCTALTTIGSSAFYSAINLANVYLPNSLLSMSTGAFESTPIESITIPASVTTINAYVFNTCSSLSSVTFEGNAIPSIGSDCFSGIASTATAYYQYGAANLSNLTSTNAFAQYIPLNEPYPCFKEGSKILTDKGYVPVQHLKKGDLVKTLNHDFKPIDMIGKREINHLASEKRIKDQLYLYSKDKVDEVMEPLIITGCHSILIDEFVNEEQRQKTIEVNGDAYVTDRKYRLPACVDERASVYEVPGIYTIYHFALENEDYYMNYGVYANGLLVETCSKRYLKELSGMTIL